MLRERDARINALVEERDELNDEAKRLRVSLATTQTEANELK